MISNENYNLDSTVEREDMDLIGAYEAGYVDGFEDGYDEGFDAGFYERR